MKRILLSLMVAIAVASCAPTSQQAATKALLVTQQSIVSIATSADQLCAVGLLTQVQCDEIARTYAAAKKSYDLAESSLATAIASNDEDAWTNYQTFHENFQHIYNDLIRLALQYGIEIGGEK